MMLYFEVLKGAQGVFINGMGKAWCYWCGARSAPIDKVVLPENYPPKVVLPGHCQRIILSLPFSCNQQSLLSFFATAYQANKTLQKQFVGLFKIQATIA